MTYIEIFLLAVALCFDTLAVTIAGGITLPKCGWWPKLKILLCFGLFQGGLTLVGWTLGSTVSSYIERFDHWIAFALLLYIGGKMVIDSFSKKEEESCVNLLCTKTLVLCSTATSIDALAVGISLAMIQLGNLKVALSMVIIAVVTTVAAAIGLLFGRAIGPKFGKRANLVGGLILVAIGVKILLEHTVFC